MASIYVTIGNIIDEGEKIIYTILNKGKWLISAVDANGNKSTKEVDVPAGDVILVTLTTTPSQKEDDKDSTNDFTDWNAISAEYPFLKAYPSFSGSCTFVDYQTDNLFYEMVVIRAKTGDADNYLSTIKSKGYTKQTNGSYMSPNRIGDYWCYVGFNASSQSGYTEVSFKGLK